MKYHPELYVGFNRSRYIGDETTRILGFAVPSTNKMEL